MLHEIHPLNKEEVQLIEGEALRSILMGSLPPLQMQTEKYSLPASSGPEKEESRRAGTFSDKFSCQNCLFFDIETTGLSADTSFLFLIGCICYEEGSWNRHQFCIRLVQEESLLLSSFFAIAKNARFLIHFNGNTFDIPFLQKRAAANGLCPPFNDRISVDLYQHFRPLRKILSLPHMKQSFLEKYTGWEREDKLSGKEVVSLFWDYASPQKNGRNQSLPPSPDRNDAPTEQTAELLLLRHNRDDLLGMLQILKLEAYLMLFSGQIYASDALPVSTLPSIASANTAIAIRKTPATGSNADTITSTTTALERQADSREYLRLTFFTILPLPHPLLLMKPLFKNEEEPTNSTLSVNGSSGELTVPVFCGTLRYYIPDYKNYYYLPLEHQAIHKSVASYVAKEYRVPARPDTCYVEKPGRFLPLPAGFQTAGSCAFLKERPIFRESYEAKHYYFEYTEESVRQEELMISYVKALLMHFGQR